MSIRHRKPNVDQTNPKLNKQTYTDSTTSASMTWLRKRQPLWVILAVASGTCAAINGVFAKLTTTALTANLASHLSALLGLAPENTYVNIALRAVFFGLNLLFNIAMWTLFTAAMTRADSTTRVSIVNVSANFFITAVLGWMIFSEKLPMGWWMGACLLAAGNVVIGSKEKSEEPGTGGAHTAEAAIGQDVPETENLLNPYKAAREEGDLVELDEEVGFDRRKSEDSQRRLRTGEEADNPV